MIKNLIPEKDTLIELLEVLAENGTPKQGIAQIIDVGSNDFLNFIETELLDDFILKGGSTCRFFEGTYGSGKTHLLQLIENLALEKGYVVCRIDLANDLSFEHWDQITKHIFENCSMQINNEIIRKLPNILFEIENLGSIKGEILERSQLPHPGFQNAILYAIKSSVLDTEARDNLYRFLLGEKITSSAMKASGLKNVKNSLSVSNAELILNTVLNGSQLIGLKGWVLLFDETDKSWMLHTRSAIPRRIKTASNIIRRFIDSCALGKNRGVLAVFAVLPNFIADCKQCYPALGERLGLEMAEETGSAWRWPVLPISAVNSLYSSGKTEGEARENFLKKITENFISIVDYCEGDSIRLEQELLKIGIEQLEEHAGKDYKRAIIKAFAQHSIEMIGV
ncbi:hypothetical protein FXW07_07985 [Methanosarcina sp. DH1]|uniref:BREX system ATP-binding domain-containing protein n=1 Tax=Methanosarcina sp. DH1 TaxID=2605695 RepID=UPI001E3507AE|nr:BREX system ATP-binding domain-containing protein [Methanosarcina sp. DH1]MCC4766557.1 hypothetical protein [Methanosarcina sp. DH1]